MSMRALEWAMKRDAGSGNTQLLLYVLAWAADNEGHIASITQHDLVGPARQSRASIFRSLNCLEQAGLLRRIKPSADRPGVSGDLLLDKRKSL